ARRQRLQQRLTRPRLATEDLHIAEPIIGELGRELRDLALRRRDEERPDARRGQTLHLLLEGRRRLAVRHAQRDSAARPLNRVRERARLAVAVAADRMQDRSEE